MPLFNTVPGGVAPKATYNTSTIVEKPIYSHIESVGIKDIICSIDGNGIFFTQRPIVDGTGAVAAYRLQDNQLVLNMDFPNITSGQIACDYVNGAYYYISGNSIAVYSQTNGNFSIDGTDHLPNGTLYWITVTPLNSVVTLQTSTGIYQYEGEITTTTSSTDWNLINSTVIALPDWVRDGILAAGVYKYFFGNGEMTDMLELEDSGILWTKAVYDIVNNQYYVLSDSYIYEWSPGSTGTEINYPSAGISKFYDLCYDLSLNSLFVITDIGIWLFDINENTWSKVNSNLLSGNFICSDGEGNFLIGDTLTTSGSTEFTYFTYPLSTTISTKTLVPALEKITSSDVSGNSYKYKGSTLYISSNTNILDYSATVDDILGGE